jgi:uracil-DNA glycosylase
MSSLPLEEWKTLNHWVEQGVFLFNTALTVEATKAGSHLGYWQWFTREVIKIISKVAKPIWMLWGAKAQYFSYFIEGGEKMTRNVDIEVNFGPMTNLILEAPHPAAELYKRFDGKKVATFSGCCHFEKCNQILFHKKQPQIKW